MGEDRAMESLGRERDAGKGEEPDLNLNLGGVSEEDAPESGHTHEELVSRQS